MRNIIIIIIYIFFNFFDFRLFYSQTSIQLKTLVQLLLEEVAENSQCIVSLVDTYYRRKVDISQIAADNFLPMYRVRYN